jgi:hypothetical protein
LPDLIDVLMNGEAVREHDHAAARETEQVANAASIGVAIIAASMRGTTRKRTGSRPNVESASISLRHAHRADLGGNAEPERPARMIAVMSGPSSRITATPTTSETCSFAPYCASARSSGRR